MPNVNIIIRSGNIDVQPPKITTTPTDLTVIWNIMNDGSLTLLDPPVQFPWPVPSGAPAPATCASWSQYSGTVSSGPGPNQWNAAFPALPPGDTRCYKYNVVYTGGSFDPEVENQGPPPGEEIEKPPKERPETTPGARPRD